MSEETKETEVVATEETTNESVTVATTTEAVAAVTSDQLLALSAADWQKTKSEFEAAIKAKAAEEKAVFKAKVAVWLDKFKTYGLPAIKYAAGAALLLKVFNII